MPMFKVDGSFLKPTLSTLGPVLLPLLRAARQLSVSQLGAWCGPRGPLGCMGGPLLAPPPTPSPAGTPAPPSSRAGRGLCAAATPARAGSRGRGDAGPAAGTRRSPGRPRHLPLLDARRGRDAICREWLEPLPPPPGPAPPPASLLPPRPPPLPASLWLPRVLPTSPEQPVDSASASASGVSAATRRPGRPERVERAGPAAGRRARAGAGPGFLPRAGRAACGSGGASPPRRPCRSPRCLRRRQSAGGGKPRGRSLLRPACRVRPRPALPGPLVSSRLSALLHFWVKGSWIVQQV